MGQEITYEQYDLLYESYKELEDTDTAAQAAGIVPGTAWKYINLGAPGKPAIKARLQRQAAVKQSEQNKRTQDENGAYEAVASAIAARMGEQLKNMKYHPKGERLPNGDILVDGNEFKTFTSTMRAAFDLREAARGKPHQGNMVNVNISQEQTIESSHEEDVRQARSEAWDIVKHGGGMNYADLNRAIREGLALGRADRAEDEEEEEEIG